MWEWLNNRGLRTFCHLREERSFDFGNELHSLLCHRCSGIYSAFLIFFILGLLFKYRGYYLKGLQPKRILITGACLLGLSPLQFLIQKNFEIPYLTGGNSRFVIGALTGLGLLHLYYGLLDNPKHKHEKPWIIVVFLLTLFLHFSFTLNYPNWINITSLIGLVCVYLVMNHLVVESLLPKYSTQLKIPIILACVTLEWSFLYWNNVLKHQHG